MFLIAEGGVMKPLTLSEMLRGMPLEFQILTGIFVLFLIVCVITAVIEIFHMGEKR